MVSSCEGIFLGIFMFPGSFTGLGLHASSWVLSMFWSWSDHTYLLYQAFPCVVAREEVSGVRALSLLYASWLLYTTRCRVEHMNSSFLGLRS